MLLFVTSQCLNCGEVSSNPDEALLRCSACGSFDVHAYAETLAGAYLIDQRTEPDDCWHEDITVTGGQAQCNDCLEVL